MRNVLTVSVAVLLCFGDAFAAAYFCSDGIFRARKVADMDCVPLKAVAHYQSSRSIAPTQTQSAPGEQWDSLSEIAADSTHDSPLLLDFAEREMKAIPFQRLPEMIEKLFKNAASEEDKERISEEIFKKVPHPVNIFDCINTVLQEGADPGSCSRMIHEKYNSDS